jgi:hypothetical protein
MISLTVLCLAEIPNPPYGIHIPEDLLDRYINNIYFLNYLYINHYHILIKLSNIYHFPKVWLLDKEKDAKFNDEIITDLAKYKFAIVNDDKTIYTLSEFDVSKYLSAYIIYNLNKYPLENAAVIGHLNKYLQYLKPETLIDSHTKTIPFNKTLWRVLDFLNCQNACDVTYLIPDCFNDFELVDKLLSYPYQVNLLIDGIKNNKIKPDIDVDESIWNYILYKINSKELYQTIEDISKIDVDVIDVIDDELLNLFK